jgi:plasmid stabilization system protein ParE
MRGWKTFARDGPGPWKNSFASLKMPKRFRVDIGPAAREDVERIHDYIALDKVAAARKWYRGFARLARSLRQFPFRHEEIPEATEMGLPMRHIIYGNYRIFYVINDNCVSIVRVIHAARIVRPEMFLD